MAYSQKYCIVQFLEPVPRGLAFDSTSWPLHVTLAGVFALDWSNDARDELARTIGRLRSFSALTANTAQLGPEKNIAVRLIHQNKDLLALHETVVHYIEKCGGTFNEPQYQHEGFLAHMTMQSEQPKANQRVQFHTLSLIDMFPDSNPKRRLVLAQFSLGDPLVAH